MKRSFIALFCWLLSPAAFAILDTNNNGLSDFWERDYNNGDLFDEFFDAQADSDSDGWTNAQEAAAGTNPFDPNPPDGIIRPITGHIPAVWSEPDEFNEVYLITPEAVTVSWPTLAGKQYTLFFSPDLTQGSWLPVGDPFIAYGGVSEYGFDVNDSDKRFWRVAVSDIDTDYDGLSNHEEFLVGTNPTITDTDGDTLSDHAELVTGTDPLQADADGDGWTDPQELAAGTDSRNQDTDGDGIPDSIDSDPLVNALAFADADGDGIPDGNDAAPNDPRGPAPSITSGTASGNPLSNLVEDEAVNFVLTVGNPGGPAPTASNLTFFLNGTEEDATITALGAPVGSTQRFLLPWTAKTTANYPTLTLQNLTLRFRDSQQATSWLNLARIDVAEWEGIIGNARVQHAAENGNGVSLEIQNHLSGKRYNDSFGGKFSGSGVSLDYRGPKIVKVINEQSRTVMANWEIPSGMKLPIFLIHYSDTGITASTLEGGDYTAFPHNAMRISNSAPYQIRYNWSGVVTDIPANSTVVQAYGDIWGYGVNNMYHWKTGDMQIWTNQSWWHGGAFTDSIRRIIQSNWPTGAFLPSSGGRWLGTKLPASITPHRAGTVEIPGLPIHPLSIEKDGTPFLVASESFHHIMFRVDPAVENLTNGVKLRLGQTNGNGEPLPPQPGIHLYQTAEGQPLSLDSSGEILLSPTENNTLFQSLVSEQGLKLLLKRTAAADEGHDLQILFVSKYEAGLKTTAASVKILPCEIVPDWNRDGKIDSADYGKVTAEKPWRFWINDTDDAGTLDGSDIPGGGTNGQDNQINGIRDLVDWFPLHLDIKSMLALFPAATHDYVLENEDNALNALETTLAPASCGNYLKVELGEPGQRNNPNGIALAHWSYYREIHDQNAKLSATFLADIENGTGGILLLEANKATSKSLRLVVRKKSGGQEVVGIHLPLSISGVEKMYRHLNILAANGQTGGMATNLNEPINQPDAESNSKNFVFVHGYNVNPNQARGWNAAMFKRLWHSESRAKFTGVTWYGYETQVLAPAIGYVAPNYQANVLNAFGSSSALKNGLDTLSGPIYIAAHSLGNMVVGSAMQDWELATAGYFMIDAAVAKEAYDETEEQRLIMSNPWWEDYDDQLRATDWYLLPWPTNDWRGKLTWINRLEGVSNAYNFYSSGEDVLKNPQHGHQAMPLGSEGVWAAQEKRKGFGLTGQILTSTYGGWDTNKHLDYGIRVTHSGTGALVDFIPKTQAELGPVDDTFKQKLMQIPFFNTGFDPVTNQILGNAPADIADLLGPNGSDYASPGQKRNTLLAEMIPAQTTAAGSNPVNRFEDLNFDMNTMKTGWPATRENPQNWLHSDIRDVSYTYTFKVFDAITDLVN